jgi:hypothetical protein
MAIVDTSSRRRLAKPGTPARERRGWFADLTFTWRGIIDAKTGRTVTTAELTPMELTKFLGYLAVVLLQAGLTRGPAHLRRNVYFAPDTPRPWHVLWSAATLAGIRFSRNQATADAIFYFEDKTYGAPQLLAGGHAINGGCGDISKSHVAAVFERAAGYPLAINPQTHSGAAVEKSEDNGAHDGRLVTCPMAPRPGRSYQLFIDCADGETAFDYRTTIINRTPQFVLVKSKPASDRFSIHNTNVVFARLETVYSRAEIDMIARFASAMALDWAALDILRDRTSRRIYVVDVNKTDMGPAVDLSWRDRERVKRIIAQELLRLVNSRIPS